MVDNASIQRSVTVHHLVVGSAPLQALLAQSQRGVRLDFRSRAVHALVPFRVAPTMRAALMARREGPAANASTAHGIARLHVLVLLYMLRSVPKLNLPSATRAWLTSWAARMTNVSQHAYLNWLFYYFMATNFLRFDSSNTVCCPNDGPCYETTSCECTPGSGWTCASLDVICPSPVDTVAPPKPDYTEFPSVTPSGAP
jgi:hypothetical protein